MRKCKNEMHTIKHRKNGPASPQPPALTAQLHGGRCRGQAGAPGACMHNRAASSPHISGRVHLCACCVSLGLRRQSYRLFFFFINARGNKTLRFRPTVKFSGRKNIPSLRRSRLLRRSVLRGSGAPQPARREQAAQPRCSPSGHHSTRELRARPGGIAPVVG